MRVSGECEFPAHLKRQDLSTSYEKRVMRCNILKCSFPGCGLTRLEVKVPEMKDSKMRSAS